MPGETEQPPRAAVPDRDGEDAGLLRGGGVAKEGGGRKLQGEIFGGVQPPWLPGAQRPSQVSLKRTLLCPLEFREGDLIGVRYVPLLNFGRTISTHTGAR